MFLGNSLDSVTRPKKRLSTLHICIRHHAANSGTGVRGSPCSGGLRALQPLETKGCHTQRTIASQTQQADKDSQKFIIGEC